MKTIKKAYHYLFYKLYKWIGEDNWLTEWKAGLIINILIFLILLSIFIYYTIYVNPYIHLSDGNIEVIVFFIVINILDYFIFYHHDQWKDIVKKFDQLPKKTNSIGGWIVFGIVLLIITNMIFAFYQMSLIDWSKYR